MSDDPSLILQGAINEALRGDTALTALINQRVYDRIPPDAEYPFVSFGPGQIVDDSDGCGEAYEVFQDINVWSTERGMPQAKKISAAVRAVLKLDNLTIETGTLVIFEHETTRYLSEIAPPISRGLLTFKAMIDF